MHTRSCSLAQLLTKEYNAHVNHLYKNPVTGNKETYDSLRAQDPEKWERSFSNEIGRLASGVGVPLPLFMVKRLTVILNVIISVTVIPN